MAKLKLHNPELAKNSVFKNLVIESFTTDPSLTSTNEAGRLWFNSSEKSFKGGFLSDDGTSVEIKQIGIDNSAEVQANTDAITQEIVDRQSADNNIQNELDVSQVSIGLNDDGSYTAPSGTNYISGSSSVLDAVNLLDSQAKNNADNISLETTNRENADTTLQTNINNVSDDLSTNYLNKTANTAQTVSSEITFATDVIISGNLTISGTQTTVETEVLQVADNIVTLNSNLDDSTSPSENAGIEVNRGTEGSTIIVQWNETNDYVEITENSALARVATYNYVDQEISTESTARTDADTALDNRITTLESQVSGNIGDLTTLTTDAQDNLVNAINEVDAHADQNASDIATEITNRTNAVNNVQSELDNTQSGAGLDVDGNYIADTLTNYITSATSLMDADKKLDTQIKTNANNIGDIDTRLVAVEDKATTIGDLTTLTTDAQDTLVNAINEVDGNLNTEITDRTNADNTLQTNINTEITNRTNADSAIQSELDSTQTGAGLNDDGTYLSDTNSNYIGNANSLYNADQLLDTQLKTTIDNLADTSVGNGTNLVGYEGYTESNTDIVDPAVEITSGTLKGAIDTIASSVNQRFNDTLNRFVKGEVSDADKSDTYTIAHNLNTSFVDVSVQVYDETETVWRFDLVVIEVIDVNTVKISLSAGDPQQIRYVIQGY